MGANNLYYCQKGAAAAVLSNLRRLRSFGLTTHIMLTFYRAIIESVLTFSIKVWLGSITVKEKLRLNRVVKTASRIIGKDLPSLESFYHQPVRKNQSHLS